MRGVRTSLSSCSRTLRAHIWRGEHFHVKLWLIDCGLLKVDLEERDPNKHKYRGKEDPVQMPGQPVAHLRVDGQNEYLSEHKESEGAVEVDCNGEEQEKIKTQTKRSFQVE